jgi:hypothetical protein
MNRFLTILVFILVQNTGFGQLIITGDLTPRSESFEIDTIRINGDSTFCEVSKYKDSVLVHREEQIIIASQTIVFHGKTAQWYEDGTKKIEGQFEFDEKIGLWKYWDEKGNLTQDIDAKAFGRGRGSDNDYMFIDGEKVMKRKNNR